MENNKVTFEVDENFVKDRVIKIIDKRVNEEVDKIFKDMQPLEHQVFCNVVGRISNEMIDKMIKNLDKEKLCEELSKSLVERLFPEESHDCY